MKLRTLALLITPEDKWSKQQIQAAHSLHWQPNQNLSTDLTFSGQQTWVDKKYVSLQLWLAVG